MKQETILRLSKRFNGKHVLIPSQVQALDDLGTQIPPLTGLTVEQQVRLTFFAANPNFFIFPSETSSPIELLQATVDYLLTGHIPQGASCSF